MKFDELVLDLCEGFEPVRTKQGVQDFLNKYKDVSGNPNVAWAVSQNSIPETPDEARQLESRSDAQRFESPEEAVKTISQYGRFNVVMIPDPALQGRLKIYKALWDST